MSDFNKYLLVSKAMIKGMKSSSPNEGDMEIDVELALYKKSEFEYIIAVTKGGVTGYENVHLKDFVKLLKYGWLACVGRMNEWDRLFIPSNQLFTAIDHFKNYLPADVKNEYSKAKNEFENKLFSEGE